ncbi:hypothetical protein, partial [Escherichia coli]
GNNLFISSVAETVLRRLFTALKIAGVVKDFDTKGREAWGLVPSALVVSRDVVQLNCSCCREVVRAPADQGWQWRNAPCLSLRCEGRYQEVDNTATWRWENMDIARVQ